MEIEDAVSMLHSVGRVLDFTACCAKSGEFPPHTFMSLFARASALVSENTSQLRLSPLLSKILARTKPLYFTMLNVSEQSEGYGEGTLRRYLAECLEASGRTAGLYALLFFGGCVGEYVYERNLTFAKLEELNLRAASIRLSAINEHKRIFCALPELEFISSCTNITEKAKNLCRAFDAVNNKFTLCT